MGTWVVFDYRHKLEAECITTVYKQIQDHFKGLVQCHNSKVTRPKDMTSERDLRVGMQ